ncbi:MAG: hypothetical protein M5R40_13020 [Anaerolineae bacterium]|nr:hypothetical protein [Anaerolineae bacterium]
MNVRRITVFVLVALLALGAMTAMADVPSVEPIYEPGNPSCTDLGYDFGFKPQVYNVNKGQWEDFDGGASTFTFPDGVNTVWIGSDGTHVQWTSSLGIDAVIVKGGPNANVYVYDPPAESFGDFMLHSPVNPRNGKIYGLSHVDFCYDYEVTVSKTAETAFTRTFDWTINKEVTPAHWKLFPGDSGTSQYTVSVTKTGFTDSDWAVTGAITIENRTPYDATLESVTDVVSPDIGAPVNCGVAFPYTLPAWQTLTCTYSTPCRTARRAPTPQRSRPAASSVAVRPLGPSPLALRRPW